MKQYRVIKNLNEHGFAIGEIVTHVSHAKFSNGDDYWHMEWDELEEVKREPKKIKLKAGKYYKTRDGLVVGPMREFDYGVNFDLGDGIEGLWSVGGTCIYVNWGESHDLIARHHKDPSKKKLMRVIQDLLLDAVYDEARNDSCIRAVKAAKKALKEGQKC